MRSQVSQSADDRELVQRVRDGSTEALAALYARHGDRLMSVAYRITAVVADAEDVLHDVFLGLPQALAQYEERGQFLAWLRRLTVRVALTRLRSSARAREVPLDIRSALASSESIDDRITLETAVRMLPDSLRVVFVLKTIEGHSHAEIASMLGITPGASEVRHVRAVKQLRGLLGQQS
jgi:RNA polymerase sigma-70 factor (ECF subfamily)